MNILGFEITRRKDVGALSSVTGYNGGWWSGGILESFAGAWQRNIIADSRQNLLAFSAVYACVALIADDISKLRIKLMEQDPVDGVWLETESSAPFLPVLRKPNLYQTRIQFLSQWITSKLLHGNTYVYKERQDQRGIVTAMHVLNPNAVVPLVANDGGVYYRINQDYLSTVEDAIVVPASEIIHDRCFTPFHPLIGLSPIYACGASTTQGTRIQNNSAKFFENMSRPSGQLTAPGTISDVTAARFKAEFEKNFSGSNIGRLLVAGDGLKYEPMTIPAAEAQLIEQLQWTVEDVARCFRVPLHKISSVGNPKFVDFAALNQDYYTQTLQAPIEALEILLEEGLNLGNVTGTKYAIELDLDGLLRMDPVQRADRNEKAVRAGWLAPNEARFSENMKPVIGGDSPMIQQQNFSLEALAKRDAGPDPFGKNTAPALPAPTPVPETPSKEIAIQGAKDLAAALLTRIAAESLAETNRDE